MYMSGPTVLVCMLQPPWPLSAVCIEVAVALGNGMGMPQLVHVVTPMPVNCVQNGMNVQPDPRGKNS